MDQEIKWLLNDKYQGQKNKDFEKDVLLLKNGVPLAYLISWVSFLGNKIFLETKPLIPRPETEYWVQKAIECIKNSGLSNPQVLDLCAGSGCIGIAVMKEIPEAHVDFVEIDSRHNKLIRKNIEVNNLSARPFGIFNGSLFDQVTKKYDFILSNPPYIDPGQNTRVQKSVLNHEPYIALFAEDHGLLLIKQILKEGPKYLKEKGVIFVEHEPEQSEILHTIFSTIQTFADQFQNQRFSILEKN